MTAIAMRLAFRQREPSAGSAGLGPRLPFELVGPRRVSCLGLLDTGAALNVLPYSVGLQAGADWAAESSRVKLSGNLASIEAHVLVLPIQIGHFPYVPMAFAWAESDSMQIILGQVNFILEFDACFFRSRATFEVKPKGA